MPQLQLITTQIHDNSEFLLLKGGKRRQKKNRKSRKSRKRKGGFVGEVISQAIVPFSLLALNTSFRGKRKSRRKKTNKRRR
jgi:hypothetical protein